MNSPPSTPATPDAGALADLLDDWPARVLATSQQLPRLEREALARAANVARDFYLTIDESKGMLRANNKAVGALIADAILALLSPDTMEQPK